MTNCLQCSKIYSIGCSKTCPSHQAEKTAYYKRCEDHVHIMAIGVWMVRCGSTPHEISNNVVSSAQTTTSPLTPMHETQAGKLPSYPNYFIVSPACNNQGAEIDLSVVNGKHNRTGRRQARGSVIPIIRESGLHVGSNPTHPIPASIANPLLSDPGAGRFFNTTLTPTPCAHYNYRR